MRWSVPVSISLATAVACGGGTQGATVGDAGHKAGSDASADAVCVYYCATKADCCTNCSYPDDSDCIENRCVWQGCASDADCAGCTSPRCPGGGGGLAAACRPVQGIRRCVALCTTVANCAQFSGAPVKDCSATDDIGDRYCTASGYGPNPPSCPPNYEQCPGCATDGDCDGAHGFGYGVCNGRGRCVCSADSQCPQHWVCGAP